MTANVALAPSRPAMPAARRLEPPTWCTTVDSGATVTVMSLTGATPASRCRRSSSCAIWSMISSCRAPTCSAVAPTTSTYSTCWAKLGAHWPPVSGSRIDQPSRMPSPTSVASGEAYLVTAAGPETAFATAPAVMIRSSDVVRRAFG